MHRVRGAVMTSCMHRVGRAVITSCMYRVGGGWMREHRRASELRCISWNEMVWEQDEHWAR